MAAKPRELIQRLYMQRKNRGFPVTFFIEKKILVFSDRTLFYSILRYKRRSLLESLFRVTAFMSEGSICMQ